MAVASAGSGRGAGFGGVRSTVIVVTWRGRAHLGRCLDALAAQDRPHRVLVLDNASADGSAAAAAEHPSAPRILRLPRNRGYAGGLAAALSQVTTPLVAWLSDAAVPERGWLSALEDAIDGDPRAAAAGATLTDEEGTVRSAGVWLTADGYGADITSPTSTAFGFSGAAALLRTSALTAVGGVPAGYFRYYEDIDTSWRLRLAGWRVLGVDKARVIHAHGASANHGSRSFHRWNERNRLLTSLRCAPARVAVVLLLRFVALTAVLPIRRLRRIPVPRSPNFTFGLRLLVLIEVLVRMPGTLVDRLRIGRRSVLPRNVIWRAWAGRD